MGDEEEGKGREKEGVIGGGREEEGEKKREEGK